mmetsp:Transcript_34641/g.38917  ORF Transcript_34641/g.38917 Transcript_34641/m.38917 type:complete len:93 (+) Transcript_34641:204-482(+)
MRKKVTSLRPCEKLKVHEVEHEKTKYHRKQKVRKIEEIENNCGEQITANTRERRNKIRGYFFSFLFSSSILFFFQTVGKRSLDRKSVSWYFT